MTRPVPRSIPRPLFAVFFLLAGWSGCGDAASSGSGADARDPADTADAGGLGEAGSRGGDAAAGELDGRGVDAATGDRAGGTDAPAGDLDGGSDAAATGARVQISAHRVEHCPIDPPAMAGRPRLTPTGARAGLVAVELLRERADQAPVSLPLPASPLDVDLTAGGVLAEGVVLAGTYRYLRVSLAYAVVSFPATGHVPGFGEVLGTLTLDLATADHTLAGRNRFTGQIDATFAAFGRTAPYSTLVPNINCPLSDSGGIVQTNGGKHTITVPMPGGPLTVVAGGPPQARDGAFPMADAVVWQDREAPGFSTGIFDVDGAVYTNSEIPSLLPMCNLLLTDRCMEGVEVPRHLPAWPMPDSASTTFSTGSGLVAGCPAAGAPGSGQDGCYNTRPCSYAPAEDTVQDQVTGLTWQRRAPVETFDWWDAGGYCAALDLGGRGDWRLPTRLELESILDVGRANPSIDIAAFPDDRKDLFWTSSPVLFSSLAYGIRFDEGYVYDHDPFTTGAVRCVAGGAKAPAQRFELTSDTAHDLATGLLWQRAHTVAADWVTALESCEASDLGGYTDWRVPSIKEFYTIVEDTAIAPCIDTAVFPDNTQEAYWTSTPGALESVNWAAWVVNFNDCYTTPAAVTQALRTRCVRDVDGPPFARAPQP